MADDASIPLFSYGTLQDRKVQLANYGRLIEGQSDALLGYELVPLLIENANVIAVSGKAVHMIARPSDDPRARIDGTVLLLTQAELRASDAYEEEAYSRIEAMLESGRTAFVYVGERAASSKNPSANSTFS